MRIGLADSNFLIMVALYMQAEEATHVEFRAQLEVYGDYVMECWHNWFHKVSLVNKEQLAQSNVDVKQIIGRILNENNGQSPG